MKISILLVMFLGFISNSAYSQAGPPPMAMLSDSGKVIVNQLLTASEYEDFFIEYCTEKVNSYALANKWKADKTERTLKSISFDNFSWSVYNSFAFHTMEELRKMLEMVILINKNLNSGVKMFLSNSIIQHNLEMHAQNIIEGRFILSK